MTRFWLLGLCLGAIVICETSAQPPLRWGMDETGGAPYVYDDRQKGFEIELAHYLAQELGRVSEPVSGDWKSLPELLQRGDIDIVMNGYEYAPQFREQATLPYYLYRFQLVVHRDEQEILTWQDLRKPINGEKVKVGVLTGSAAQRFLEKEFGDSIEIVTSDDVANQFELVATRQTAKMRATVQDNCAATYYVATDKESRLKRVAVSQQRGFYVILTRKEDEALREKLNLALRKAHQDGTLERIYRKYDLWNEDQKDLGQWMENWPPPTEEVKADWSRLLLRLVKAAGVTVFLAVTSFPLAMLLGLLIAIVRLYGPRGVAWLAVVYVEVIRGTPLLLQLFFIFYVLPELSPLLALSPMTAGIVGLAINYSASEAENYRAGILAIPRGQEEAALALGMPRRTMIWHIIVPQAVRIVIPPVTNDFIALFKDTSVCSVILITELTRQYNILYNNHRDLILELAFLTAGLYLMMSYPLALLARYFEKRFDQAKEESR